MTQCDGAAQVLESGEEVRLQRNALTVLSVPRGDETVSTPPQTRPSCIYALQRTLVRCLHLVARQCTALLRICKFLIANI